MPPHGKGSIKFKSMWFMLKDGEEENDDKDPFADFDSKDKELEIQLLTKATQN